MQCMDAPTRPSAWEGVLDCTAPGNVCPQVRMLSTPCIQQVFENQIGCWKSTRQFPGWIWGPLWQLHWQHDWFWGLPQPQCLLHPIRGEVCWSKKILPGYINWVKFTKVWPKNCDCINHMCDKFQCLLHSPSATSACPCMDPWWRAHLWGWGLV